LAKSSPVGERGAQTLWRQWLSGLSQDIRHGARIFARNPALTVIAIVSIAFGTGANVAMFSLADNLLLLFVGWEGVGLCSYLLISFWYDKVENAVAGKKADPEWLGPLVLGSTELTSTALTRAPSPPAGVGRPAAVLILFGEDLLGPGTGPDVLLLRRSDGLPSHPGQVGFPGGAIDEGDAGPVATALREATEEVGLALVRAVNAALELLPGRRVDRTS